jgi:uncharacterized alkaline shock family protein YloU
MNVFNRALIVLLCLALLVATGAVLLVSLDLVSPAQLAPAPWFQDRLAPFTELDPTTWGQTIAACAALLLVGLVLLALELRPGPRAAAQMTLTQDALGRVTVAREGILELVRRAAAGVPGVLAANAWVDEGPQGLRIRSRVAVVPTANVAELAAEVQERVRAAVEHHLGRPVAEVRVDTRVAPTPPARPVRRVR